MVARWSGRRFLGSGGRGPALPGLSSPSAILKKVTFPSKPSQEIKSSGEFDFIRVPWSEFAVEKPK